MIRFLGNHLEGRRQLLCRDRGVMAAQQRLAQPSSGQQRRALTLKELFLCSRPARPGGGSGREAVINGGSNGLVSAAYEPG